MKEIPQFHADKTNHSITHVVFENKSFHFSVGPMLPPRGLNDAIIIDEILAMEAKNLQP